MDRKAEEALEVLESDDISERLKVLQEAAKIVAGDRDKQYGKPEDNFSDIAQLWSVYLGFTVTDVDVAMMMVLQKVARGMTHPKRDNFVDICGYSACGAECYKMAVGGNDESN